MSTLMIDNHDSFVYNIVDILRRNGESVNIIENDENLDGLDLEHYDSLVISPGPGNPLNPQDRGNTMQLLSRRSFRKVLGICFGHQLLGYYLGSRIYRTEKLYHGEVDRITNFGGGIMSAASPDFSAVRYHSLAITTSQGITVDALSATDGTIMAFHSKDGRFFGLQFHPESHYSQFGENIIKEFLKL